MSEHRERLKFIRPLEPFQVETPPVSADWLHEIKYDGFRTQVILDWAGARAFSRNGHDWSKRYWPIVNAAEKLPAESFIIDGEMIAPEPDGRPNFHRMHSRMVWNAEQLAFVAFDLLHLDGQDLRSLPLIERKARLWNVIKPAKESFSTATMLRAAAPHSSRPSSRWALRAWSRSDAKALTGAARSNPG